MSYCYARILTNATILILSSGCQTTSEVEPVEVEQPSPVKIQIEAEESSPVKVQVLEDKQTSAVLNRQEIRPSVIAPSKDDEYPEAEWIKTQKMQEPKSSENRLKSQQPLLQKQESARLKANELEAEAFATRKREKQKREQEKRNAARRETEQLEASKLRAQKLEIERQDQREKKVETKINAVEEHAPTNAVVTVAKAKVLPKTPENIMNLADLPLPLKNGWTLDRKPNPITQNTECVLSSAKRTLFDGYDNALAQLIITPEAFYFDADSNLDLSYEGSGVFVDGAPSIEFEGLQGESSALIEKQYKLVKEALRKSSVIMVSVGFWPTWPATELRRVAFQLDDFAATIKSLELCGEM